ncbi:hypothetical protein A8990_104192 [Paenibacillus taihuensis]|uniref:Uncharacterized protein n=1 Tax=Paenibacillus taihuensis TaxID=1156355 RepID=A0A3D9SCQ3_9BACL|nr:hypothetical protein A8990_104192 [Paenibacillus taihuensis]
MACVLNSILPVLPDEKISGDKNIIFMKAANIAAFFNYAIKFLPKPHDKNLIPFLRKDWESHTYSPA